MPGLWFLFLVPFRMPICEKSNPLRQQQSSTGGNHGNTIIIQPKLVGLVSFSMTNNAWRVDVTIKSFNHSFVRNTHKQHPLIHLLMNTLGHHTNPFNLKSILQTAPISFTKATFVFIRLLGVTFLDSKVVCGEMLMTLYIHLKFLSLTKSTKHIDARLRWRAYVSWDIVPLGFIGVGFVYMLMINVWSVDVFDNYLTLRLPATRLRELPFNLFL